jgi:hypothetical protein
MDHDFRSKSGLLTAAGSYFFISTERHELRATSTSDLMMKNDHVVLDVESAEEAAAELDTALNEIYLIPRQFIW